MPKKVFLLSFFSFLICLLLAMPTLADGSPWIGSGEGSKIESGSSKNSAQELNEMLRGFEQGCSVGSTQLSEVFSVVQTIKLAISNARSSKNCENLNEVMIELNSSSLQARSLYPSELDDLNSSAEITIRGLESRKKEVLFMISQTSDADEIQDLKEDLRSIQLDLQQYSGENAAYEYNDKQIRKVKAMNLLTQNTYLALNTILNNKKCLVEHPELLETISGISLGVGASLASISPVGAAASVVGWGTGMISGLLQYFEEKSDQKKLMSFDVDQLPISMTCTIEKLNDLYCSAEDTLIALEKYNKYSSYSQQSQKKDPIWIGAQITNRSIPIAFNWLQRLKNGSSPSNPADASKFNSIDEAELALRKGMRGMEGSIAVYDRDFNPNSSKESQWIDLKNLVNNIAFYTCPYSATGSTSSSNTICEFKDVDTLRFYLIGITSETTYSELKKSYSTLNLIFDVFRSIADLESRIAQCAACPKEVISFNSNDVRNRYFELYRLGEERLNLIKQREGQGDLSVVFASAKGFSPSESEYNQKPLRSFQNLIKFLQTKPEDMKSQNRSGEKLISETLDVLQIIVQNIECANLGTCDLFTARTNIIDATEISKDSSKLSNRIRYLVKSYVDYSVFENSNENDNWKIQYMASRDYLSDLQSFYTTGDTKIKIENQALAVQSSVSSALKNFQKNYSSILKTTFETLNKNSSQDPRAHQRVKEVLCYQTLGLKWEDTFKTCLGLEAKPIHAKGKKAPKITRDLYNQERRVKSCSYRNFLRINNLEERRVQKKQGF